MPAGRVPGGPMVSVLPSHPANICRLALGAISRVQKDIHGESTWATHGTHRVPGRPQRSSRPGALAPKTQPVSVHAEGQYILRLDVKQCARNGSHDYRGNGNPVSVRTLTGIARVRSCFSRARLCPPSSCSRNALLLVLAAAAFTLSTCARAASEAFSGPCSWQAPRMGLHDLLSVKIPASRIQGLASHPLGQFPHCPGQPRPLTQSECC